MNLTNTRRHVRYRMHTPVFVVAPSATKTVVQGLVSKLSRTGMEVYAGVNLQCGELMEVQFQTTGRTIRVVGMVRNRSGFCFGLEFRGLRVEHHGSPIGGHA
jgi:PilZ domain